MKLCGHILSLTMLLGLCGASYAVLGADQKSANAEDVEHEREIKEFTKKMVAKNYPALFKKAADEFGVPIGILEAIAFEATQWQHYVWTREKEDSVREGAPLMHGIMGLWDTEWSGFGRTLSESAKLIDKTPQELKREPLQNIRGAAALLKKNYRDNHIPGWSKAGAIDSWFYAVVTSSGYTEEDAAYRTALAVYERLAEGYHKYGIDLNALPNLNLDAMRQEVAEITRKTREKDKKRRQNVTR